MAQFRGPNDLGYRTVLAEVTKLLSLPTEQPGQN
jgi:hypothetical protein